MIANVEIIKSEDALGKISYQKSMKNSAAERGTGIDHKI